MKRFAAARVAVTFLLSLALLVTASAQKSSPDSATPVVASAKAARLPVLEEATDDGDENLSAPGQSYLQPTMLCLAHFVLPAQRTFAQIADSVKKNSKLYRLKSVLLV